MNALIITLWTNNSITLPIAYNHILQVALYSAWEESFPQLHDEGFSADSNIFRMFTFSPLRGKYEIKGKTISFSGAVSFEVRSPVQDLLHILADYILNEQYVRLGHYELPVVNMETADRLFFPASANISMLSPISVHQTTADGKTIYYTPQDEKFILLITENLASKIQASGLDIDTVIGLVPYMRTLRRRVTTFKGIYITGYTGRFLLETDPETMAFLYYTGLGARNSQGFGMFEIEDIPPR